MSDRNGTVVMGRDDAEEYTQALGQVVAGGWRQVALGKRLGVPNALGITTEEWVENRLGGYLRLSLPDRREAVAELTEEGMSTREIGEVLGVGNKTVARDREAVSDDTEPAADPIEDRASEPSAVSDDTEPAVPVSALEPAPEPEPESWNEQTDALLKTAAEQGSEDAARALIQARDARVLLRVDRALREVLSTVEARDNVLDAITRTDRERAEDRADLCQRMADYIALIGAANARHAAPNLRRVQ